MIERIRFGVIACSKCKRVWGIELNQIYSRCPNCKTNYNVKNRKILYKTSNNMQLRQAIAQIQRALTK